MTCIQSFQSQAHQTTYVFLTIIRNQSAQVVYLEGDDNHVGIGYVSGIASMYPWATSMFVRMEAENKCVSVQFRGVYVSLSNEGRSSIFDIHKVDRSNKSSDTVFAAPDADVVATSAPDVVATFASDVVANEGWYTLATAR